MRILVPTDFSPLAASAMRYAAQLCLDLQAEPIFLHVYQGNEPADALERLRMAANEAVGSGNNLTFECLLAAGNTPWEGIANTLQKTHASAAVMSAHPRGAVEKLFVSSQTAEVIRHSAIPVLVLPENYAYKPVRRIGFSTDLQDLTDRSRRIAHLVKALGATLDLFHIYPVYPALFPIETIHSDALLADLGKEIGYEKLNFHFVNTHKDNASAEGIGEYIRCYKPDWLAMVTSPKSVFDALVNGSLTREMVGKLDLPLLAYSDPDR